MHCRTRLELLRQLRLRRGSQRGFTVVELMVVVAVLGLLVALIIPRFLEARTAAQAAASVGQAVGLAKECAIFLASGGVGHNPDQLQCDPSSGGTFSATWIPALGGQLLCLGNVSSPGASQATITVSINGTMACTFS